MVLDIPDVFGRCQENFGKVVAIKLDDSYHETLRIFLSNLSRLEFPDLTNSESSIVIGLILSFVDGGLSCHGQCITLPYFC